MGRLASDVRGNFYPVAPEVIPLFARLLKCPPEFTLLDPCAGRAAALKLLAESTGCPPSHVHGIELEETRAAECKALLPDSVIVGPASFFDLRCHYNTFSLAWVNPPFSDECGGGGRTEYQFLCRATDMLQPNGIMALVLPENVWKRGAGDSRKYFSQRYDQRAVLRFPADYRPYDEIIVVGRKLRKAVDNSQMSNWFELWGDAEEPLDLDACRRKWEVSPGQPPRFFEKGGMTEPELFDAVLRSPLWRLTDEPKPRPVARPPLPLGRGHIALLLSSGQLDGIVEPPDEEPHVVRGTAIKVACLPEVTEECDDSGRCVKTTTVIKERIQLTIRAVDQTGEIRTFE